MKQLVVQDVYSGKDTTNIAIYEAATTLLEARSQVGQIDRAKTDVRDTLGRYQTEQKVISLKQVARVWNRIKK